MAQQAFGESAIAVTDASSLVSLGDLVLSSDTNVDLYTGVLFDRIGKTIISNRAYTANSNISKDSFTYGMILQKLYVDMPDAVENQAWKTGSLSTVDQFVITVPDVKQKLFESASTWEVDGTIPDDVLKTAFTNAQTMGAFISSCFVAMQNKLNVSYENNINLCRAMFIGNKIHSAKPCGAVNLLSLYNTEMSKTLTVAECLTDADFLRYASSIINLYVTRITKMSTLFNDEGYKRFTPPDKAALTVLADFACKFDIYLQSDVFHNDLVKLPNYEKIPYWQGTGTSYAFADTSKISVKIGVDAEDADINITQSGVLAVLHDVDAMGVTINNKRSKSAYNAKGEYTNYFEKATIGYYNDMSENGIVFFVSA